MVKFQQNADIAIQIIKKYRYGPRAILMSEDCYAELQSSMKNCGITCFSAEYAMNWCRNVPDKKRPLYLNSVRRLVDVYEHGRVMASHIFIYRYPSVYYQNHINSYISNISAAKVYTQRHLKNIRNCVSQFCCFAEYNGVISFECSFYDILEEYDAFMKESSKAFFVNEGLVVGFLTYLADKGICSHGHGIFLHFLQKGKRLISLKALPSDLFKAIESFREESQHFPAEELYLSISDFTGRLAEMGYSDSVVSSSACYLSLLYVFLDREELGYDRRIVELWYSETCASLFMSGSSGARRTFEMYDDFTREGDILPSHYWKHCKSGYDSLPEWCRAELDVFIKNKRKEGWSRSTVQMYMACVLKFCLYPGISRIGSFGRLTAADIKDFNLHDKHKTSEAKNAYNSRIRKFLIYLELKEVVPEGIHYALPCQASTSESIVETLSYEDLAAIDRYCQDASTMTGLRDTAILRIALDTGLRSSDIIGLKTSSIDWKKRCLRIIQQKTGVEHIYPIETATCNALFKYLRDVRFRGKENDALFLSLKAPYGTAPVTACRDALLRAGAATGRAHLVRKTFGSLTLNSGSSVEETALALGHSDTSTVHKYTSLDPSRSRMCPLSLAETGLFLEGRY